ncbi:hypothetical protein M758_UG145700 [Ceratodon purpureus]|nr:hypothetical protein M758_UG145700 [Ceratodon purpureus]
MSKIVPQTTFQVLHRSCIPIRCTVVVLIHLFSSPSLSADELGLLVVLVTRHPRAFTSLELCCLCRSPYLGSYPRCLLPRQIRARSISSMVAPRLALPSTRPCLRWSL